MSRVGRRGRVGEGRGGVSSLGGGRSDRGGVDEGGVGRGRGVHGHAKKTSPARVRQPSHAGAQTCVLSCNSHPINPN